MPGGRQLNIRSDQAYEIAAGLADKHGKSITRIVEEALEAYARGEEDEDREATLRHWRKLLEEDRKHLNDSDFRIEDLYDPETGLPA